MEINQHLLFPINNYTPIAWGIILCKLTINCKLISEKSQSAILWLYCDVRYNSFNVLDNFQTI